VAGRTDTVPVFQLPTGLIRILRYFSWQPQIEADFSRGVVRDLPRSSIPAGGVYDAVDYLADKPGVLRKRGGTGYQSSTLGATTTGVNFVAAPEFPTGGVIVGLGADGNLYDCTTGSADSEGAFPITTLDTPKLYVDKLIVTSQDGTTGPEKIYVTGGDVTFAALGGTPPPGRLATSHLSYLVLGGSAANTNRLWFSPIPNIEATWDLTNAYIDTDHTLTALASIQGVLLCFSAGATERVIGSVPPGTEGENMSLQPLGQVGCADARSIALWGTYVVFASQEGVYVTNGAGFDSLTEEANGTGILAYWRQQYATVAANGGFIAGGIVNRNYYVLTLGYGSTIVDTLVCYLPRKSWTRTANIGCLMYAPAYGGTDELYGASMSGQPGNRILTFSGCLTPVASNKNDANGTAVTPSVEFRMIGQGVGLKVYGDGHLTYDMRDGATDNPTLAVQIATGIEAEGGYNAVPESPLAESTGEAVRKRFSTSKDAQALNVKVTQTNASSKTEIYLLEVDQRTYDLSSEIAP
jgi:hypothetical protein